MLKQGYKNFECPGQEDETNVVNVEITSDMSKMDVLNKILEVCLKYFESQNYDNSFINEEIKNKFMPMRPATSQE